MFRLFGTWYVFRQPWLWAVNFIPSNMVMSLRVTQIGKTWMTLSLHTAVTMVIRIYWLLTDYLCVHTCWEPWDICKTFQFVCQYDSWWHRKNWHDYNFKVQCHRGKVFYWPSFVTFLCCCLRVTIAKRLNRFSVNTRESKSTSTKMTDARMVYDDMSGHRQISH